MKDITNEQLALNIKSFRVKKGLSVEFVANHLNITRQTYCKYEKNAKLINPLQLYKLSKLFECQINDFYL